MEKITLNKQARYEVFQFDYSEGILGFASRYRATLRGLGGNLPCPRDLIHDLPQLSEEMISRALLKKAGDI